MPRDARLALELESRGIVAPSAADLLTEAREHTDALLDRWAERLQAEIGGRHGEALAYALRTPGKRVRAALVTAAFRSVGGQAPGIAGVAAAVETVHTYSLVHDDLPCMDDDDLRRGRPTTHRRFDVPTATRVGFLLVPVAARVLAAASDELALPAAVLGRMATELFEAGGIEGMVGGQWLDLEAERRTLTLPQLMTVHRGKTGALIRASCTLGGIAAEAAPGSRSRRSRPSARTSASPSRSPTTCSTAPAPARCLARRRAGTRSWPSPPTSACWGWMGPGGRRRRWPGGRSSTSAGRGCRRGHSGRWPGIL